MLLSKEINKTRVYREMDCEPDNPKRDVLEIECDTIGVYHLWTWTEVMLGHSYNGGPVREDWFNNTHAEYIGEIRGMGNLIRTIRAF